MRFLVGIVLGLALVGCGRASGEAGTARAGNIPDAAAEAVFAGGCFWCTEADFEKVPGVYEAVSGYAGGDNTNPTYRQVTLNNQGHYEAVAVYYDPAQVSYETLVRYFFRTIDPTDDSGQFCDKGPSYRTAVFVDTPEEETTAKAVLAELTAARPDLDIVTPVRSYPAFYVGEAYHQDYARRNVAAYTSYRLGCRRDARLRQLWGDEAGGKSLLD